MKNRKFKLLNPTTESVEESDFEMERVIKLVEERGIQETARRLKLSEQEVINIASSYINNVRSRIDNLQEMLIRCEQQPKKKIINQKVTESSTSKAVNQSTNIDQELGNDQESVHVQKVKEPGTSSVVDHRAVDLLTSNRLRDIIGVREYVLEQLIKVVESMGIETSGRVVGLQMFEVIEKVTDYVNSKKSRIEALKNIISKELNVINKEKRKNVVTGEVVTGTISRWSNKEQRQFATEIKSDDKSADVKERNEKESVENEEETVNKSVDELVLGTNGEKESVKNEEEAVNKSVDELVSGTNGEKGSVKKEKEIVNKYVSELVFGTIGEKDSVKNEEQIADKSVDELVSGTNGEKESLKKEEEIVNKSVEELVLGTKGEKQSVKNEEMVNKSVDDLVLGTNGEKLTRVSAVADKRMGRQGYGRGKSRRTPLPAVIGVEHGFGRAYVIRQRMLKQQQQQQIIGAKQDSSANDHSPVPLTKPAEPDPVHVAEPEPESVPVAEPEPVPVAEPKAVRVPKDGPLAMYFANAKHVPRRRKR